MTKEIKYAVIIMTIGIITILAIYYLNMRGITQPTSGQPALPGQDKSAEVERPITTGGTSASLPHSNIPPDKTESPLTPSQTSSIPQMQPSSLPGKMEQEILLYTKTLDILNPRKIGQVSNYMRYEICLTGYRQEIVDEDLKIKPGTIRKRGMATIYQENCEKAIKGLEELVQQYPDSAHVQHYQKTLILLKQMLHEDEELPYRYHRGGMLYGVRSKKDSSDEVSPEEKVKAYIHYLREECLLNKSEGTFKMCFDQPQIKTNEIDGIPILGVPNQNTISFGRRIVALGNVAVPELVKLLDDRRLIVVDDEIAIIPARFYRYQDAAIDILKTMFSQEGNKINPKLPLAQKAFPVEVPQGEYFSEYMEKQTTQNRQKIIGDIKQWVEQTLANPPKQEELPETSK